MYECEQIVYRGYIINVFYDDCPENPRAWSTTCHMICQHRRYDLGDKGHNGVMYELRDLCDKYGIEWETEDDEMSFREMIEALSGHIVIKPISIFDHSGVTIFWGAPIDRWDSGTVGFGYCEKDDLDRMGCSYGTEEYPTWRDRAEAFMEGEMDIYDDYLRGYVYGYNVTIDEDAEDYEYLPDNNDSCCGFYGESGKESMIKEAQDYIDTLLIDIDAKIAARKYSERLNGLCIEAKRLAQDAAWKLAMGYGSGNESELADTFRYLQIRMSKLESKYELIKEDL